MLKVFVGYEPRQPLAFNVLQHSIIRHASKPVSVIPLILSQLPINRRGLTEFTYSRFLVPHLCNYGGVAIFMDADIVVKGDIYELAAQADNRYAVQVMQEQAQFEWASVMLFNCYQAKKLTPAYIEDVANPLFDMSWGKVGTFTEEWNCCVGYSDKTDAKLYHFTQGLPIWHETRGLPQDAAWFEEYELLTKTVSWKALMGKSVHAKPVLRRMMERYADPA